LLVLITFPAYSSFSLLSKNKFLFFEILAYSMIFFNLRNYASPDYKQKLKNSNKSPKFNFSFMEKSNAERRNQPFFGSEGSNEPKQRD
jgi:hypothetical protein